ncbi:hypothetical protein ASG58_20985 [Rhizobium sp. Leaf383]|nr:hypothetical protein ASG58_20985 [Rhizobium sp. Leaf383]
MKFGRGYEFASKPNSPDQVTYLLHFKTMKFYESSPGVVSLTKNPAINIARLEAFYNRVQLWTKFLLPIPGKGNLTVRFSKPLEYKVAENGQGTVEAFQLEFLTQP